MNVYTLAKKKLFRVTVEWMCCVSDPGVCEWTAGCWQLRQPLDYWPYSCSSRLQTGISYLWDSKREWERGGGEGQMNEIWEETRNILNYVYHPQGLTHSSTDVRIAACDVCGSLKVTPDPLLSVLLPLLLSNTQEKNTAVRASAESSIFELLADEAGLAVSLISPPTRGRSVW